ncbi:MAG: Ppx/GppA phosphatase family protein, partial [Rhodospirillaceae bacterium]
TAACRAAANRDVFLDRVKAATGLTLEVIPPEEEAQLALAGCAPLLEPNRPRALVFDIGGGSTELAWVALDQEGRAPEDAAALRPRLVAMESLSLGVVTMAEASGGGHLDDRLYDDVVAHVSARLAPFQARLQALGETPPLEQVQMLGTSGTVTTLGAIALGLNRYDRARVDGLTLDFPQIRAVSRQLLAMRPAERAGHPCIGRARADLVLAGCAILEAVCQLWPVGRLRVADRGIREGMLLALMQTSGPGDFSGATRDRDDGCSEVGCLE